MVIDPNGIQRILVIKLRAIGDVLLSTAVLPNLRSFFGRARIDVLTERYCRQVLEGNPYVDEILEFERRSQSGVSLIQSVRRRGYNLVLDLFGNPRSALVTALSGAVHRVGYRFSWRQYCYSVVVEPRGNEVHNVEFNLDALRAIGVPLTSSTIIFPIPPEASTFADRFVDELGVAKRLLVGINAGGGWTAKRWPPLNFAALADRLVQEFDAHILIFWGPGEESAASTIQTMMHRKSTMIPQTTLKELGALMKRCHFVITNDSGPMHIAAALGTPVLAIFGPTRPELQGPVGDHHHIIRNERLSCLGCNYTECPIGTPCMEELSVDEVFAHVQPLVTKLQLPTSVA